MARTTDRERSQTGAGAQRARRRVWGSLATLPVAFLLLSCTSNPAPLPTPRAVATTVPLALTPAPNVAGDPNVGRRLFPVKCATCHTLPGVASGILPQAPNLNNVGVKPRLAGDTIPNTPENMKSWILSPQTMKQGSPMVTQVTDAEAQDLTAYIYSLPYNPNR